MALVTLNSINVDKSALGSEYSEIVLYPLMTDAGPSGYTLVNSLEELRLMFTPSVTTPNWLYAETLASLGYKLLVAKLMDTDDYLSLRIFESFEEEVPVEVRVDRVIGDVIPELGLREAKDVEVVLESKTKKVPKIVSYPKRFTEYNKISVPWEYWNQESIDPGEGYTYSFKLFIPEEFYKGDYVFFTVKSEAYYTKTESKNYILGFGELEDFNNISSISYSDISNISIFDGDEPISREKIKEEILKELSKWGFYKEYEDGDNCIVFSSFVPVLKNTTCKFGGKYSTLQENKSGHWDIICSGYEDHKLIDFYTKDCLSSDNVKLNIVKNFDDMFSIYVEVTSSVSNTKTKNETSIDSEYFRVSLDRKDKDHFIEKVLETSKYITCVLYKPGDISGDYTLKNRLDKKVVSRTNMLEVFKGLQVLDEGEFDIIVDADLGEDFRRYLQYTYQKHFCLKFFQLENIQDVLDEDGIVTKKALLPTSYYETNGIVYFTGYPMSGIVSYPMWLALLAKVKLEGAFAGEIFPDSTSVLAFDVGDGQKAAVELEDSKYICNLIFDGYRYFIPSVPVKHSKNIFSIDLLWTTIIIRNRIIPSIDANLSADDFIREFNTKVRRFMNGKDTRISSAVITGYKRVDRTLLLEIEVTHDDRFVDSILLDVTIKIN